MICESETCSTSFLLFRLLLDMVVVGKLFQNDLFLFDGIAWGGDGAQTDWMDAL